LKALSDRSGDHSAGGRHVAGSLTAKLRCSVAVRARGTSRVPVAADRSGLCCRKMSVCLSVCLSVTRRHSVKTTKHIIGLFSPSGSHTVLVLTRQSTVSCLVQLRFLQAPLYLQFSWCYYKCSIFLVTSFCLSLSELSLAGLVLDLVYKPSSFCAITLLVESSDP